MVYTPRDVANWMMTQMIEKDELPHREAAIEIMAKFGRQFVTIDEKGFLLIHPEVLKIFLQIEPKEIVWEEFRWRWREEGHGPGRKQ